MKRTPLWIFLAAVGVQLAALGLCVWVMEHWPNVVEPKKRRPASEPTRPEEPAAAPAAEEPAAPTDGTAEAPATSHAEAPAPVPAPPATPRGSLGLGHGGATVRAIDPPPRPVFGVPPHGLEQLAPEIPAFITEVAEGTSQLVVGKVGDRSVHFGFYPDGNIRFVDVDNARYAGKAESARARMHEVGGDRSFTVQIGVDVAGRLQATFSGGLHRYATFPLEPLVGWSAA